MFSFTTVVFDGTSPTFYFTNTSGWNTSNSNTSIHFRQLCNSFWNPSTSCFVTQICLPQFSIFEPPYPASYCTHINTLVTIKGLQSSVNFNWRNFSTVKNSITTRYLNRTPENSSISMCTGWGVRCALGEKCKHLCVQGEVWWKRDIMRLHRTGFIQMSNVNKNITVEAKLISPPTYNTWQTVCN